METSRGEMEALRSRTKELEFQLRESSERCTMLEDNALNAGQKDRGRTHLGLGVPDAGGSLSRSSSRSHSYTNATSAVEVQRLLAEAEVRSEAKLADLRSKIRSLETERNEVEEEWSAKLQERLRDLEKLRRTVTEKDGEYAESLRTRKEMEVVIDQHEEVRKALERETKGLRAQIEEARGDVAVAIEAEVSCPRPH